jgi:hypothetical protein
VVAPDQRPGGLHSVSGRRPNASPQRNKSPDWPAVSRVLYHRCVGRHTGGEGHLSGPAIADGLCSMSKQPTRDSSGVDDTSSLLGLAPGGVCRAGKLTLAAVRSYRTFSPLPAFAEASAGKPVKLSSRGGLFSVALSLTWPSPARPVGVTHHHRPTVLGLSSPARGGSGLPRANQESYYTPSGATCLPHLHESPQADIFAPRCPDN